MKNESEKNVISYPDSLTRKIRRLQGKAVKLHHNTLAIERVTEEQPALPAYRRTSTEVLHGDGLPSHVRLMDIGQTALASVIDIRRDVRQN